jgi:hypothetical protein
MVGRLKVAPPHAALDESAKPVEVAELLKGDNSEEAFSLSGSTRGAASRASCRSSSTRRSKRRLGWVGIQQLKDPESLHQSEGSFSAHSCFSRITLKGHPSSELGRRPEGECPVKMTGVQAPLPGQDPRPVVRQHQSGRHPNDDCQQCKVWSGRRRRWFRAAGRKKLGDYATVDVTYTVNGKAPQYWRWPPQSAATSLP